MTHDSARQAKKNGKTKKPPTLPRTDSQVDREQLAYHEAGHAVMAFLMGAIVRYVTIVPKGKLNGRIFARQEYLSPLLRAAICWGGPIGEEMWPGFDDTYSVPYWESGDAHDIEDEASFFISRMTPHFWTGYERVQPEIADYFHGMAETLARHFATLDAAAFAAAVRAVAERLLRQDTVKGKTLIRLMSAHVQPLFIWKPLLTTPKLPPPKAPAPGLTGMNQEEMISDQEGRKATGQPTIPPVACLRKAPRTL
jgi:hypothetical protein